MMVTGIFAFMVPVAMIILITLFRDTRPVKGRLQHWAGHSQRRQLTTFLGIALGFTGTVVVGRALRESGFTVWDAIITIVMGAAGIAVALFWLLPHIRSTRDGEQ